MPGLAAKKGQNWRTSRSHPEKLHGPIFGTYPGNIQFLVVLVVRSSLILKKNPSTFSEFRNEFRISTQSPSPSPSPLHPPSLWPPHPGLLLGTGIDRRRRFIQQQHRGLPQHHPSQADQLSLSEAQVAAWWLLRPKLLRMITTKNPNKHVLVYKNSQVFPNITVAFQKS